MRFAAYCRVSTDHEEQLSSLENQREFFEEYAQKTGDKLIELYADEGISGKSLKKRDSFLKMLDDSGKGGFDYVAVKDISRFARNTGDFLYGIRTLRQNGVDVKFLSNNQTVLGESEFVLTVFAALAQQESENLSKRVIFGKKQNAKKGRVPNNIYGYDKQDTYTLTVNEKESSIVKLIFKWYTEGYGTRHIAMKLNEMGIPTKKNAKWISKTIRRILQNSIYIGKLINNKSVTKDFLSGTRENIPPEEWYIHDRPEYRLVSDDEFYIAQERLIQRREQYKNENPGNRYSNRHIFSNLIKCGECGKSFNAKVYHWKNTYVRYRCCIHNNGGNIMCKNSVTIDEQKLLEEVKKYLFNIIEDKNSFAEKLKEEYKQKNCNIDVSQFEKVKQNLMKRKDKFKEMYVSGVISMAELKKEMSDIEEGLSNINAELNKFGDMQKRLESIDDIAENVEQLLLKSEYTNNDMRRIIDKIIIYPDKSVEIFMK
ncbi:MAG: recombinase family protein [Oscillospiraceae bacterium]|nr:recombinase family protein [Oscillospiraceae bacterium]